MDTLALSTSQDKAPYYVYTLSYPNGDIFYVGKGTYYPNVPGYYNRIDIHEWEAKIPTRGWYNKGKIAAIHEIWESGERVKKDIVAWFADEEMAYLYEYTLINMTAYSDKLTNVFRGYGTPRRGQSLIHETNTDSQLKPKPPQRPISSHYIHTTGKHWGCFQSPKGIIYHQIVNIHAFARRFNLHPFKMIDLANREIDFHRGWILPKKCPPKRDF